MSYQQMHEKEFSLFAPTIRTSYKYQINDLKEFMKHMTVFFGPVFNQKSIQIMAEKYMKLVLDNYCINIGW